MGLSPTTKLTYQQEGMLRRSSRRAQLEQEQSVVPPWQSAHQETHAQEAVVMVVVVVVVAAAVDVVRREHATVRPYELLPLQTLSWPHLPSTAPDASRCTPNETTC